MTKKDQIIKLYEKKQLVHPSYGEIAKKVGVFKSYAWKVIQEYLKNKKNA